LLRRRTNENKILDLCFHFVVAEAIPKEPKGVNNADYRSGYTYRAQGPVGLSA
jgi:hypothetical protein